MLLVPFEVRIVVLGKRLDALEGRLLVLYITDRYAYETLLQQVCTSSSLTYGLSTRGPWAQIPGHTTKFFEINLRNYICKLPGALRRRKTSWGNLHSLRTNLMVRVSFPTRTSLACELGPPHTKKRPMLSSGTHIGWDVNDDNQSKTYKTCSPLF